MWYDFCLKERVFKDFNGEMLLEEKVILSEILNGVF